MTIKGLTPEQSELYRQAIFNRESGGSGGYSAVSSNNYLGGYQMGTPALKEAGLVRMDALNNNSALNNDAYWTIPGGKQTFLNSPDIQDKAFYTYTNKNYDYLRNGGRINDNTPTGDVAGYLGASHLTGGPGVAINGLGAVDANNVSNTSYFGLAKSAVTGGLTDLPANATIRNAAYKVSNALSVKGNGSPPKLLGKTGLKNVVSLDLAGQGIGEETVPEKIKNPLEKFSSFNSIFTLSVLDSNKINNPDSSYKKSDLGRIILRSGGGFSDNRVKTAYTSSYNPDGKFEFYIDNVSIDGIIAYNKKTQGTNSINISFDVYEPYSVGLFLQSLKLATIEAKYTSYTQAPLLLTLQFVGYDSDGNPVPTDDTLDRHIPIKISTIDMKVNGGGSMYNVSAIPWNEVAFSDQNTRLPQDTVISGKTVQEILQSGPRSLQAWINSTLEQIRKNNKPKDENSGQQGDGKKTPQSNVPAAVPNEIAIIFPSTLDSATASKEKSISSDDKKLSVNPNTKQVTSIQSKLTLQRNSSNLFEQSKDSLNEIGKSKMPFKIDSAGSSAPVDEEKTRASDDNTRVIRKANYYDPANKEFRFPQGTSITTVISEILLMSEYCRTNVVNGDPKKPGLIKWFRIESQVFVMESTDENNSLGETPTLTVYRVVPYYVHEHHFMSPSNQPRGYDYLTKQAVKEYNYIYTGKNVDILDFDITINNSAFTTLYADKNNFAGDLSPQQRSAVSESSNAISSNSSPAGSDPQQGARAQGRQYEKDTSKVGGPPDDIRSLVAKNFHEALMNDYNGEMINLSMEIMGDPYFIADSGMGNFTDKPKSSNLNLNGSVNYQSGEVDVVVNFRTPVDIDPTTGYADFGHTELVQGFSGLYVLTEIKNQFVKGKFTQVIQGYRRPNQKVEALPGNKPSSASEPKIKDNSAPLTTSPAEKSAGTTTPVLDAQEKGNKSPAVELWETKVYGD